jgi:hypothetical protein
MSDSNDKTGLVPLEQAKSLVPPYLNGQASLQTPIEMGQIYRYEVMVDDLALINSMNGPLYMKEFLKAKELASSYYSKLILDYEQAKNETKRQYALSYLERSQVYIADKKLKDTDETKKQYVCIDPQYTVAKDKEDMFKALVTLVGNKVDKFQNAYEASKKIYESTRDAVGSRTSLPSRTDEQ